jgi:hypothetical protein
MLAKVDVLKGHLIVRRVRWSSLLCIVAKVCSVKGLQIQFCCLMPKLAPTFILELASNSTQASKDQLNMSLCTRVLRQKELITACRAPPLAARGRPRRWPTARPRGS